MFRLAASAILLYMAFSLCLPVRCVAQYFAWATQSTTNSVATAPIIADDGYSYLGGNFRDSAFYEGQRVLSTYRPYSGYQNLAVAKFDPVGKLVRVVTNTGFGDAKLLSMCSDQAGNIYLLGQYLGSISLGSFTMTCDSTIFSYFIAKCDPSGNFLWVRSYNNPFSPSWAYNVVLASITCDRLNNVYIFGSTEGTYNANGLSMTTPANETHLFLARLSPGNGLGVWTQKIEGTAYKYPKKILADAANDIIVVGQLGTSTYPWPGRTCVFNNTDTLSTSTFISQNIFIAKYTAAGVYKWVKPVGTLLNNQYNGITSDPGKNIFFCGYLGDTAGGFNSYSVVRKMNEAGITVWTKKIAILDNAVAAGAAGLYVLSGFTDSFQYQSTLLRAKGEHNLIVKMDTVTGNLQWTSPPLDPNATWTGISTCNRGMVLYSGINDRFGMHFGANYLNSNVSSGYIPTLNRMSFTALLTDSSYAPPGYNRIDGSIFNDPDRNCIRATAEKGLNGFAVIATPGPYYATADSSGNYSLKVQAGSYSIQQIAVKGHHVVDSPVCRTSGYSVTFSAGGQTNTGNDFGHQYHGCSLLKIDAPGNAFDCKKAKTRDFSLCNYGLDTARSIQLNIHYPGSVLAPVGSSIPWTSYTPADSTLRFFVNLLPPDSCLTITVRDTAICPSNYLVMQPYPFRAELTPFTGCYFSDTMHGVVRFIDRVFIPISVPVVAGNKQNAVEIYPNPTKGPLYLQHLSGTERIRVISPMGQKVIETAGNADKLQLDMSALAPGVYFIVVSSAEGMTTSRIVKL